MNILTAVTATNVVLASVEPANVAPATGINLQDALIPAAAALLILIILFALGKKKK
jgi:LPXTG-motif cell wall-anchored protein